jgi:hypothetical protein
MELHPMWSGRFARMEAGAAAERDLAAAAEYVRRIGSAIRRREKHSPPL